MSASKRVKEAGKFTGLTSLTMMAKRCGKTYATLINWYNHDRDFFEIVLAGVIAKIVEESQRD